MFYLSYYVMIKDYVHPGKGLRTSSGEVYSIWFSFRTVPIRVYSSSYMYHIQGNFVTTLHYSTSDIFCITTNIVVNPLKHLNVFLIQVSPNGIQSSILQIFPQIALLPMLCADICRFVLRTISLWS
jgi:hypothetical protein